MIHDKIERTFNLKGMPVTKTLVDSWAFTLEKFDESEVIYALAVCLSRPGLEIRMVIDELIPSAERIASDRWRELYENYLEGGGVDVLTEDTIATVKRCGGTGFIRDAETIQKAKERFVAEYVELHGDKDAERNLYKRILLGGVLQEAGVEA